MRGKDNGAEVRNWRTSQLFAFGVTWGKCAAFLFRERKILRGVSSVPEVQEVEATLSKRDCKERRSPEQLREMLGATATV